MKARLPLAILFLLLPLLGIAGVADSLQKALATQKGKDRIQTLTMLADELPAKSFDQSMKYVKEAINLAIESGDDKAIILANRTLAKVYEKSHYYPEAITALKEVLRIAERSGDKKRIGVTCTDIGRIIMIYRSDLKAAMDYYVRAIDVYVQIDDHEHLARTYVNVANAMARQGDYDGALGYYKKALPVIKDSMDIASICNNIGASYFSKKDYGTSLEWIEKALGIKQRLPTTGPADIADSYNNIGSISIETGDTAKARDYLEKALAINIEAGDSQSMWMNYHNLGNLYQRRKMFKQAETLLLKGMAGAEREHMADLIQESYAFLARLYAEKGDYRKAYEFDQKYATLTESLLKTDISQQVASAKATADAQQREREAQQRELESQKAKELLEVKNERQHFFIAMLIIGAVGLLITAFLVFRRFLEKEKANTLLESRNLMIEAQKFEIEVKNKEITDSIAYAQRLQEAILPDAVNLAALFPESFVLFLPKDIVSGDFFWCASVNGKHIVAVADCTGHGVPGALMSMIGNNLLHQAVYEKKLNDPAAILADLNRGLHSLLLTHEAGTVRDGMDIALCVIDDDGQLLRFAGANRGAVIIRRGGEGPAVSEELAPDRTAIGGITPVSHVFAVKEFRPRAGDSLYLFSDGYADQFGGPKGKKMMVRNLKEYLLAVSEHEPAKQKQLLEKQFRDWKGTHEQVDDVLLVGIRLS